MVRLSRSGAACIWGSCHPSRGQWESWEWGCPRQIPIRSAWPSGVRSSSSPSSSCSSSFSLPRRPQGRRWSPHRQDNFQQIRGSRQLPKKKRERKIRKKEKKNKKKKIIKKRTLRAEVNVSSLEDAREEGDHVVVLLGDAERSDVGQGALEGWVVLHRLLNLRHGVTSELGLKVLPGVVRCEHGWDVVGWLLRVAGEPQDVAD